MAAAPACLRRECSTRGKVDGRTKEALSAIDGVPCLQLVPSSRAPAGRWACRRSARCTAGLLGRLPGLLEGGFRVVVFLVAAVLGLLLVLGALELRNFQLTWFLIAAQAMHARLSALAGRAHAQTLASGAN